MHAGVFERQPLRPLSQMLMGALSEGCLYIADADDPVAARGRGGRTDHRVLAAFRIMNADESPSAVSG